MRSSKLEADTRNASRSGGSSMYALRTRASRIATALRYSAWRRWRRFVCLARSAVSCFRRACSDESSVSSEDTLASAESTAAWASSSSATTAESWEVSTPSCEFAWAISAWRAAMRASTAAFSPAGSSAAAGPTATSAATSPTRARDRRPIALVSLTHRSTLLRLAGQRLERRSHVPAKRADLCAIVLVRDGSGAMVELELLQRCERAVALLEQLEPASLVVVELVERVDSGSGSRRKGSATATTHATASAAPSRSAKVNASPEGRPRKLARRASAARACRATA